MSDSKDLTVSAPTALAIGNWDDLLKRSEFYARSQLIPVALRNKPADVAIILQMGLELGLSQMQSLNSIDVIQGKPTIPPQLGLAMCRSRLNDFSVEWKELTDTKASIVLHRGKESYPTTWDTERARKLGLLDKDNYRKQLGTMLKWRAVGEGLRALCSDVLKGCYLEGELDGAFDGGGGNESSGDKTARLAALNKKPEPKDVVSEVVESQADEPAPPTTQPPGPEAPTGIAPEPEPSWGDDLPTTVNSEPEFDPLGDYPIKTTGKLQGKPIKTVSHADLESFAKHMHAWSKKNGTPLTGGSLEDVSRVEDYLRTSDVPLDFANPAVSK